jgi:hypothetical protein
MKNPTREQALEVQREMDICRQKIRVACAEFEFRLSEIGAPATLSRYLVHNPIAYSVKTYPEKR